MAAIEDFLADAKRRMDKSIEATHHEFNSIRTGRASPALLDRITIDYYGTPTPLKQLATINVPEARMLTVQPFDPSTVSAIERSLKVMDTTALSLCMDNRLTILVFELAQDNIRRVAAGERIGTIISTP